MGYKTITTKIASARTTKSKQSTSYQYPTGNGVVLTGSSINSQTSAYLDVTTPGAARTFTAVSGGAGTSTLISNIQYLDANNVVANAIAASTTGGNILINGNGFANTSRVYVNNQLVTNTFVNSNAIIATLSANSVGNVTLAVFNSSGQSGVFSNSNVRFSGAPSWVTAAAVSSVNGIASNIALQASGDGTLTYSLKSGSGSLPTGITLLSSGYLTGTATGYSADTVVSFTLIVSDPESQETQQNFNYTVFIGDTYFKQTSLLLSATVSNTFISDSSTNNFLITRNGDTRPSRLSPYWPGGWSGYFDGTGQNFVTVSTGSGVAFGTGDYTVEGFCYATSWPSTWRIISFNTSAVCGLLNDATNGSLKIDVGAGAVSTGITLTLNRWFHIAVVRQSGTLRIYIDGVQGYSVSNTTNYTTSQSISLGGISGFTQTWDGYLSNFRIVKGTAVYTANFTPATSSLTTIGNVSMLTLRDSILADDSPLNSAITRGGTARLTTFSPFNTAPHTVTANTNSVYFDGTGDNLIAADSVNFDFGTNDFTIEAWIYPTTISSDHYIFSMNTSTGSAGHCSINVYQSNWRVGLFNNYMPVNGTVSANSALNQWNHIALVRYNNNLSFYVNGSSIGTAANVQNVSIDSAGTFAIGRYSVTDTNYYNGYISNFRAVKGTAVYTANFTPATSALTAISGTSLLACQANTIIDSNTTPKTITVNGNPNVSLANPFGETVSTISNYTWSPTSYGASAYFDGTGDYLSVPNNSVFNFGSGDFTIECWVYRTNDADGKGIITYGWPSLSAAPFLVYWDGLNSRYSFFASSSTTWDIASGVVIGNSPPLNSWGHIAITRSGNTIRCFFNGILGSTTTSSAALFNNTTQPLTIGGGSTGLNNFFGYIQDVRITKGTALYTGPFIPPAAPVSNVANVSLLTLQSDIGSNSAQFVDQSPNNHLITRNGNASQGTFGPLVPSTWSAYFDGTGDYLTAPNNEAFSLSGDFTIECWTYMPTVQTCVFAGNIKNTGEGDWAFFYNSSFGLRFITDNATTVITGTTTISPNTWYHVAVTRSGTSVRIFSNGTLLSTTTNSSTNILTGTLQIGRANDGQLSLIGYISNLRIVKGTALYTANFTPSTTTISPVANTSLLTLRGPAFTDDSGNNFTITRFGDTKIVPFGPFSPQIVTPDSYSYRFSNASDYISTTSSNLAFGSNNWTIEGWVYPRFTANSGVFQVSNVQYGLTNSNLNTIALGFSNSNKAIVRVANATYTSTGTSITANAWTHLALVKNSNVSKLYINGTLDSTIGTSGSITDTVSYTGTTNVAVGGYGSTSALANAYISNFRIVSNSAVYTENFTPAVGPLAVISGTTLLTCQANTILDASTGNLSITANANVTPVNFNPFDETVTVGQQYSALADGGSAYFDGSGDFLTFAGQDSFAFGTNDFTIEAWIYRIGTAGFVYDSRPASTNGNYLQFAAGATLSVYVNSNTILDAGSIPQNSWTHIALTRSGTNLRGFVNGMQVGSTVTNSTSFINGASRPVVGANGFNTALDNCNSYVSNFRVIKGNALYTSNFVPPAAPALPTVANTSLLLNFTSSGVIDSTGRNVLETVADAKVTTNLKKYGTGSYYFDGTGDYMYVMGNSTELAFGAGDFTIEFWMYTSNAAQTSTIYGHRPFNTNGAYITLYLQSNNLNLYVNSADRIIGGTLVNNTWHHVALARSGISTKLFLDGVQVGSTYTDSNSYLNPANRPIIGENDFGPGFPPPYSGYIDDLRITKGYARYTANFTVPSEPFITK